MNYKFNEPYELTKKQLYLFNPKHRNSILPDYNDGSVHRESSAKRYSYPLLPYRIPPDALLRRRRSLKAPVPDGLDHRTDQCILPAAIFLNASARFHCCKCRLHSLLTEQDIILPAALAAKAAYSNRNDISPPVSEDILRLRPAGSYSCPSVHSLFSFLYCFRSKPLFRSVSS